MSLSSHADDVAVETTWLWRGIAAESCYATGVEMYLHYKHV
jgi:hypothetical protein